MADYVSTTNACKLCTPLGACVAFRGVEGAVPFLHGSQGCATYMRRYLISHFREPMDIASSSLGEKQAVYGGGANLKEGVRNVVKKYHPELIGVATTCLTETIGDDVAHLLGELSREWDAAEPLPALVRVSTPSYQGSHMEGFHAAVKALVEQLAEADALKDAGLVNLLPGFVSPEDLRHLRELCEAFGLNPVLLPDYSETLDAPAKAEYETLPAGGTPVADIRRMGGALATLELGRSLASADSAGAALAKRCGTERVSLGMPVGLRESDALLNALETLSGKPMPRKLALERGRLIDAYIDGHKYLFAKRAVVYGEEDLVVGLASFLAETGVVPVLCATGAKSASFAASINAVTQGLTPEAPLAKDSVDFHEIGELSANLKPDLIIGNSKGFKIASGLGVPLIRVGFPIHDRFGGQRLLHLGYRGALRLYDEVVNAVLQAKQDSTEIGYGYL